MASNSEPGGTPTKDCDEEERIAYNLEVFKNYFINDVDPNDFLIAYKPLPPDERWRLYRHLKGISRPAEKWHEIFDTIARMTTVEGRYIQFVEALEVEEYTKIAEILRGNLTPMDDDNRKQLNKHLQILCDYMELQQLLYLFKMEKLISQKDYQTLNALCNNEGNSRATSHFLHILPAKHKDWYVRFLKVLVENNHKELAQQVDEDMVQRIKQSERIDDSFISSLPVNQRKDVCKMALNKCHTAFLKDMHPPTILDKIIQNGLLPELLIRDISDLPTTTEKNRCIIQEMKKRSVEDYQNFKSGLREENHGHLADLLEEAELMSLAEILQAQTSTGENVGHVNARDNMTYAKDQLSPNMADLYIKTLEEGLEKSMNVRVNVVGPFGAGKTTLARRLQGMPLANIKSTEGIDVHVFHCSVSDHSWLPYVREKNHDMLRLANISINQSTNQAANSASSNISATKQANSEAKTSVKTTRPPIKENVVQFQASREIAEESCKSRYIYIWDFAGQFIYRATHQLFHSTNAVYLLVINLSLDMRSKVRDDDFPGRMEDMDLETQYKFWINSIQTWVGSNDGRIPPVILIGTHFDRLPGTESEKQEHAEKKFEEIRSMFDNKPLLLKHIQQKDFTVTKACSLGSLQKYIIDVADQFYGKDFPASWIPLQMQVQKMRMTKDIASFTDMRVANDTLERPLPSDEDLKTFLTVQHMQGNLVFYDEDGLSETIVLNAQYIIDAFKMIVTHRKRGKRDPASRPLWNEFETDALLSGELVQQILAENHARNFRQHWSILDKLLQKLSVFVQLPRGEGAQVPRYLVPIMLRDHMGLLDQFLGEKARTNTLLAFRFDNAFVPPVLFYRLVCATVARWRIQLFQDHMLMSKHFGVYRVTESEAALVLMRDDSIDVGVVSLIPDQSPTGIVGEELRKFVESFIKQEMQRCNKESPQQHKLMLRCNNSKHGSTGSTVRIEYREEGVYPCPDGGCHSLDLHKVATEWNNVRQPLQTITQRISPDFLNQVPTQKQINGISKAIGQGWENLALDLDIGLTDLDIIKADYQGVHMQKVRTLVLWTEKNGRRATLKLLLDTLGNTHDTRVDWGKIKKLFEV